MSNANIDPISYASSITGFTSFTFTIFTFLRVFWETILTLWSAPKQMKSYLDNLRIELHNESAYFKSALKRTRSRSRSLNKYHNDVGPFRVLDASVSRLHREFNTLEEPFLIESPERKEQDIEKSERSEADSTDGHYAPMTLTRRWKWLRSKARIISIADQVNRIQTQRIACDTTDVLLLVQSPEFRAFLG